MLERQFMARRAVLHSGDFVIGPFDARDIVLRTASRRRQVERSLHDGYGFSVFARGIQAQGYDPARDGDKPMIARPMGRAQHIACLSRALLHLSLAYEDFRTYERDVLQQRMLIARG